MKKQSQNSSTTSETSTINQDKKISSVGFNIIHILMMQICVKAVYENAPDDTNTKFFDTLVDVLHILEHTIDQSDNEELKNAVQYEPVKLRNNDKIQP